MASETSGQHEAGHVIVPVKYYVGVLTALLVLTTFTVYTAKFVDLGNYNLLLALVIALIKAVLVFAVFMGLYWDRSRFNILIILSTFFFFSLFIGLSVVDIVTRGSLDVREEQEVNTQTQLRVKGYLKDTPVGKSVSTEELLKLKTATDQ